MTELRDALRLLNIRITDSGLQWPREVTRSLNAVVTGFLLGVCVWYDLTVEIHWYKWLVMWRAMMPSRTLVARISVWLFREVMHRSNRNFDIPPGE